MALGLQERPSVCLVSGSVSRGCLRRTGDLASVKGARPEGTAHPAAHTAVLPARAAWPRGLASVTAPARSGMLRTPQRPHVLALGEGASEGWVWEGH